MTDVDEEKPKQGLDEALGRFNGSEFNGSKIFCNAGKQVNIRDLYFSKYQYNGLDSCIVPVGKYNSLFGDYKMTLSNMWSTAL